MSTTPEPPHAFFVTQIGQEKTPQRARANEVTDAIVRPVVTALGLGLRRADLDPTPGKITTKMLQDLLSAAVVIADLTDKNANVYYELAVAHAFGKPVVSIIDDLDQIAFDVQAVRCIAVPKHDGGLAHKTVTEGSEQLRAALQIALDPDYAPTSPITELATA